MKKITLFIFCLLSFASQAQINLMWAKKMGATSYTGNGAINSGYSIAIDSKGNSYTTGHFNGTGDFDPGSGICNLASNGDAVFISKLDASGNFIWAKSLSGTPYSCARGFSIAIDKIGNIYITGIFCSTIDFDPGTGIHNLTPNGSRNGFVCKLDSSGNFMWVTPIGGPGAVQSVSIIVDANGNTYTTGYFSDTVDFDSGPGIFKLTSAGKEDIFVCKLNVSGDFVWAGQMGGNNITSSGADESYAIALDGKSNIYISGYFVDTADFDPGPGVYQLINSNKGGAFVSKLDSSGNFIWAKVFTGTGYSESGALGLTIDDFGNVYSIGGFEQTIDFDPGAGIYNLTSIGWEDIFICKLDALGNFIWAKQMGGSHASDCYGYAITSDYHGNIYCTGTFTDTVDFDPGAGIYNLHAEGSSGYTNTFISKLDSYGNFIYAGSIRGSNGNLLNYNEGRSIAVDSLENIYFTGDFQERTDFDPGSGTYYLYSAAGDNAIVISKLSTSQQIINLGINETENNSVLNIYPNPSSGIFTVSLNKTIAEAKICIYDVLGNCVLNKVYGNEVNTKINGSTTLTMNLSSQPKGIYFVQIVVDGKRAVKKIILN